MCRLNVKHENSVIMNAIRLLRFFLDQHGYESKISDRYGNRTIIELRKHSDVIEIDADLNVSVYCDIVEWVGDKPQLVVSLYNPRSLHFIAKYLRCIPKKEKDSLL